MLIRHVTLLLASGLLVLFAVITGGLLFGHAGPPLC